MKIFFSYKNGKVAQLAIVWKLGPYFAELVKELASTKQK